MSNNERGQAALLAVGLSLVTFAVAGLVVDGTRAFLLRRTLQSAADGAALGGSGELDVRRYYRSGGRALELDPSDARAMAGRMLSARGVEAEVGISGTGDDLRVSIRSYVPTMFLRLVGVNRIPVAAEARAEPVEGSP
jgi:hypothetical protein